jgi:hypothetical protein
MASLASLASLASVFVVAGYSGNCRASQLGPQRLTLSRQVWRQRFVNILKHQAGVQLRTFGHRAERASGFPRRVYLLLQLSHERCMTGVIPFA